jgi:hypothetical protein
MSRLRICLPTNQELVFCPNPGAAKNLLRRMDVPRFEISEKTRNRNVLSCDTRQFGNGDVARLAFAHVAARQKRAEHDIGVFVDESHPKGMAKLAVFDSVQ